MRKGHGKSAVGKCSFLQCQYDLENRHKLILRTRAWNWLPNIRNLILWMTGTMRKLFMCYIKKNNNWGRAFFLNSKKNWSIVMITKSIWASKYFAFLSSFYDLHCHKTKPWDYISIKNKTKQNTKEGHLPETWKLWGFICIHWHPEIMNYTWNKGSYWRIYI